jgi:hypothetical protein
MLLSMDGARACQPVRQALCVATAAALICSGAGFDSSNHRRCNEAPKRMLHYLNQHTTMQDAW